MARKPDELKQYVADIAKERNFTPEQTARAVALVTGTADPATITAAEYTEVIAPLLDVTVGRQSDYSRSMDAVRTAQKKAADDYQALVNWRNNEINPMLAKANADKTAAEARAKAFEDRFGPLDETEDLGTGKTRTATGDIVDTKKLEEYRQSIETAAARQNIALTIDLDDVKAQHMKLFPGELLPSGPILRKLGEMAQEAQSRGETSNATVADAYNALYGERVEEVRTASVKKHEDELIARGAKEERARLMKSNTLTGAVQPEGAGPLFDHLSHPESDNAKLSDEDRAQAFGADLQTRLAENEAEFQRNMN